MNHFFVEKNQLHKDGIMIDQPGDINHIRQVLRLREGDRITVAAGDEDREYLCRIRKMDDNGIQLAIEDVYGMGRELPVEITLYQGLPKGDKMEWVIQKAVELGAARIVPVATKRAVVKLTGAKAEKKVFRWQGIARSAAEQSKRSRIPLVEPVMSFPKALEDAAGLDSILIPYEEAEGMDQARKLVAGLKDKKSLGIFIGPEGGFEPSEVQMAIEAGADVMSLGHRILRTETAGMMLLSVIGFSLDI